jgi:glycosyltransferase involved in cell wall biosynthesis
MTPNLPLVSIIIPSFNQGEFIEDTIRSILAQDHPATEIIVMDGGSTDATLSILKRYSDRLSYVSQPDSGQAHAINKGFAQATGDIVTWLNSDDVYVLRTTVSTMVAAFERRPRCDFLYGNFVEIDAENRLLKAYRRPRFSRTRLLRIGYISQPATFFRRRVIERLQLREDLRYALDLEFWLRAADAGFTFEHLDCLVAAERLHDGAKCVRDAGPMAEEARAVRESFGARHGLIHRALRFVDRLVLYVLRLRGLPAVVAYTRNSQDQAVPLAPAGVVLRTAFAVRI